jgi:hypothetical protein
MKNLFPRILLGLTLLGLPSLASAQTVGTLLGHIYDQSGSPIRGVKAVVTSPTQIGGARTVTTDSEGTFRVPGLTPGVFTVTVSASKLRTTQQNNVKIVPATTTEIDIVMEVESATEEIQIVTKAPPINTSQATVGEAFDLGFINDLPLSTRDFQGVQALTPGVIDTGGGNPSIRGGSYFNNTYTVDGFQTTDPVTHTFTENFSFDAMNSVQVSTAGFGAEHSDTLGGVTNIVTKSGSNRLEVDGTFTYTDQNLYLFKDARDRGTNRLMVGSVSVGGPIIKDRLWYYVSGEGVSNVSTLPATEGFPPHPGRNVLGFSGTAKLTWQISPRNKIDFSSRYEPGDFNNILQSVLVEPEAEARQYQNTRFFGADWHSAVTDQLLLQFRAGLNQNQVNVGPQSCKWDPNCANQAGVLDIATGILRQNYTSLSRDLRQTVELSGSLEWFQDSRRFGSHDVKLGARFSAIQQDSARTLPGDSTLTVVGDKPFSRTEACSNDPKNNNGDCHHSWLYSALTATHTLAYLSEAWKPTRHLTITPEVAMQISKSRDDKGVAVTDTMAFTPHLQVAWDATHDGRTVIRGSFNNYVDPGFLALARFTSRQLFRKRCDWNEMAQAFIDNCRISGGEGSQTVGVPCAPDGLRADGTPCNTKLRLPRVWEYTIGAEREVFTGITLGFDYIYRKFVHQWEDIETNAIWNQGGTGMNVAGGWKTGRSQFVYDLETPDEARRQYHSLTVVARKNEGLLKMRLSYTWTKDMGTEDSGFATLYLDNPGQNAYYYGPLAGDFRHDIRAQATYQVRPWFTMGVIYQFLSGAPYNRYFFDDVQNGDFTNFRAKRGYDTRGTLNPDDDAPLRLPDLSELDLQARFNLRTLISQPLDVFVDVLNLMALRTTTSVVESDGPFWGRPQTRMRPLQVRLGLQYRFR